MDCRSGLSCRNNYFSVQHDSFQRSPSRHSMKDCSMSHIPDLTYCERSKCFNADFLKNPRLYWKLTSRFANQNYSNEEVKRERDFRVDRVL